MAKMQRIPMHNKNLIIERTIFKYIIMKSSFPPFLVRLVDRTLVNHTDLNFKVIIMMNFTL